MKTSMLIKNSNDDCIYLLEIKYSFLQSFEKDTSFKKLKYSNQYLVVTVEVYYI